MSQVYDSRTEHSLVRDDDRPARRRVSWGALICGVVIAFTIQLLLSLLGAAIGFGSLGDAGESSPATYSIASGVWWVVSSCLALFAGGYAAARLARAEGYFDGALYGIVCWGVVTLLTVYLISTAIGSLIEGGFSALSSVTSSVGSSVKSAAAPVANSLGVSPDAIKQQAEAYLQPARSDPAAMSPQDAQKEMVKNLVTYQDGGGDAPAAKERMIDIMAAQLKISRPEAAQKFETAQAKVDRTVAAAKDKAANAAAAAASATSQATLALFADLLLGAIAGALGGALAHGSRRRLPPARVA